MEGSSSVSFVQSCFPLFHSWNLLLPPLLPRMEPSPASPSSKDGTFSCLPFFQGWNLMRMEASRNGTPLAQGRDSPAPETFALHSCWPSLAMGKARYGYLNRLEPAPHFCGAVRWQVCSNACCRRSIGVRKNPICDKLSQKGIDTRSTLDYKCRIPIIIAQTSE